MFSVTEGERENHEGTLIQSAFALCTVCPKLYITNALSDY